LFIWNSAGSWPTGNSYWIKVLRTQERRKEIILYEFVRGPEVMKYGDIPDPILTTGRILIQVKAVSINPVDYKIRQGDIRFITGSKFQRSWAQTCRIVKISGNIQVLSLSVIEYTATFHSTSVSLALWLSIQCPTSADPANPRQSDPGGSCFFTHCGLTALHGLRKCGSLQGRRSWSMELPVGGHFAMQIARAWGGVITAVCSTRTWSWQRNLERQKWSITPEKVLFKPEKNSILFSMLMENLRFWIGTGTHSWRNLYHHPFYFSRIIPALRQRLTGRKKIVAANMRSRPEDYVDWKSDWAKIAETSYRTDLSIIAGSRSLSTSGVGKAGGRSLLPSELIGLE